MQQKKCVHACDRRPDRSDLGGSSGIVQTAFIYFGGKYSGKSTADKIADLRKAMKENGADVHILTSLYDIAWLLNIRGNDIDYVPVVLSYLVLNETECIWFYRRK